MDFKQLEIVSTCKGGGYIYARTSPQHPKANSKKLYPLHRVLMENKLGRFLEPGEIVHHINHDKTDNSLDNLELLSNAEHSRKHQKETPNVKVLCSFCRKDFQLKPHKLRQRMARSKNKNLFCTRKCLFMNQIKS